MPLRLIILTCIICRFCSICGVLIGWEMFFITHGLPVKKGQCFARRKKLAIWGTSINHRCWIKFRAVGGLPVGFWKEKGPAFLIISGCTRRFYVRR